ncbi:stage III sporulation protein AB [Kineothrix sp. MB12-C1]|uniref:stage III sporulation protein AB n=1 Tax=Kineothrix sp. MB12-C1 TaxID=3070215 RepID=UPI0027D224D5|nr:stage III sporulation protein AB [Kineothrix sp. MB12-C1]WMC92949.1 stage III sporulation protein AB [Kineothrix sp. MB12-C1]
MLRIIGILCLMGGSIGFGWTLRGRMKERLSALYQWEQIFKMLQNEITYSKASLPEACRRIAARSKEPYRKALEGVYEEMAMNNGCSFSEIWKRHMEECLKETVLSKADKKVCMDFGDCVGYMDGEMQSKAFAQYLHRLGLEVKRLEEEIANKSKVIMSLSIMGGLLAVIILL